VSVGSVARPPISTSDGVLAGAVPRPDVELRVGRHVTGEDHATLVEVEAPALERVPAAHQAEVAVDEQRMVRLPAQTQVPRQLDVPPSRRIQASCDADADVERERVGDVEPCRRRR
jgi:hypothetical protein